MLFDYFIVYLEEFFSIQIGSFNRKYANPGYRLPLRLWIHGFGLETLV
jgi:hypothetical protein